MGGKFSNGTENKSMKIHKRNFLTAYTATIYYHKMKFSKIKRIFQNQKVENRKIREKAKKSADILLQIKNM